MPADLPPRWKMKHTEDGVPYYKNYETGESRWSPPPVPSAPPMGYADDTYPNTRFPAAASVAPVGIVAVHPESTVVEPAGVIVIEGPRLPPPGAPEGGKWVYEKYCGLLTWMIGIFVFWFVCCCPCDDRLVYRVGGVRYNESGAIIEDGCCRCC